MPPPSFPDSVPDDCNENIRDAIEYWISIHPSEGLPGRQHFDPVDVPRLLPFVCLLDVSGDPPQFRVRLMGTQMVAFHEKDFTGYWYHDAFPQFRGSNTEAAMVAAARTGQPRWYGGAPAFSHTTDYKYLECIALPLARDGRNVDMLLLVHAYN